MLGYDCSCNSGSLPCASLELTCQRAWSLVYPAVAAGASGRPCPGVGSVDCMHLNSRYISFTHQATLDRYKCTAWKILELGSCFSTGYKEIVIWPGNANCLYSLLYCVPSRVWQDVLCLPSSSLQTRLEMQNVAAICSLTLL